MLEREFKERVLKDLAKLPKFWFKKLQEVSRRGILDIIMCLDGYFVHIELKKEDGILDKLQEKNIKEITTIANGLAFVARPSSWTVQFKVLQDMVKNAE